VLTFDQLVLFEYLFPGQLPSPARVPADFVTTWERTGALERLLDGNPAAAATLRRFTNARTNKQQAANLDLFTHILGEMQRRWGGNPFGVQRAPSLAPDRCPPEPGRSPLARTERLTRRKLATVRPVANPARPGGR